MAGSARSGEGPTGHGAGDGQGPGGAGEEHRRVLEAGEHLFQQLGLREVPAGDADLAMELDVGPRIANPRGALQGGLVATLADIVAGRAAGSDGAAVATTDLTVHFLAGIDVGPARAEARVLRRGRRVVVVRVDIHDAGRARLAATATVAFSVRRG